MAAFKTAFNRRVKLRSQTSWMGCSRPSERPCLQIQDGEWLRKTPVSPLDLHTCNSTHKCPICENACRAHNTLKTNAGVFSQDHPLYLLEQNLSQDLQGSLSRPGWLAREPQGSSPASTGLQLPCGLSRLDFLTLVPVVELGSMCVWQALYWTGHPLDSHLTFSRPSYRYSKQEVLVCFLWLWMAIFLFKLENSLLWLKENHNH